MFDPEFELGYDNDPPIPLAYGTLVSVIAPRGVKTALSYSATPSNVCTVDAMSGALTLVGVGDCVVTATAASTANYNEAAASVTVTVHLVEVTDLKAWVNIAEKAAGFSIRGNTASEAGVPVTVTVGEAEFRTTSDANGAWSVRVPPNAPYITEPSVSVTVSANKTGFTFLDPVMRTVRVDSTPPRPSTRYPIPTTLKVGSPVVVGPISADSDVVYFRVTGLPSGLRVGNPRADEDHLIPTESSNGFIYGMPDTADPDMTSTTMTLFDRAGNSTDISITFPEVAKGDQTLTGFSYRPAAVTVGVAAPSVTAPTGAQSTVTYSATPSDVCTVGSSTGALTLLAAGECEVTAMAAGSANYNEGTATFTVTVQPAAPTVPTLVLNVDPIAGDDTVNIAEKMVGFALSGGTGSEGGVMVTVTVGTVVLTATSDANGAWVVSVPANAAYITESSVTVTVSAAKTGFTPPSDVRRILAVDLIAPSVSYPVSNAVMLERNFAIVPSTTDTDIASYSAIAVRIPGRNVYLANRLVVSVSPTLGTIFGHYRFINNPSEVNFSVTVMVTDTAGNRTEVNVPFYVLSSLPRLQSVNFDPVTSDNIVNIEEWSTGFTISGDTASEPGVKVSVWISPVTEDFNSFSRAIRASEALLLRTAVSDANGNWSVNVPAKSAYITDVLFTMGAFPSKEGWLPPRYEPLPSLITAHRVAVDLRTPYLVPIPVRPPPLGPRVGERWHAPLFKDVSGHRLGDLLVEYSLSGELPSWLEFNGGSSGFLGGAPFSWRGAVFGQPETAGPSMFSITATVTDEAGNVGEATFTLPAVAKGEQTLEGFSYSPDTLTFGDPVPTVAAPSGAEGPLSYSTTSTTVCAVDTRSGALTLVGVGECVVTATAASTDNYNEGTAEFTVTVQPAEVSVSVATASATEGEAAEFTVTLSGAVASDVALDWSTTDGTATAGADYTSVASGTLTVTAGTKNATFTVMTLHDTLAELDEMFTVTLAAPGTGLPEGVSLSPGMDTAIGTIADDDPIVASVAADAGSVTEGGPAQFTVTLAGGTSTADVEVTFTLGGTATAGDDYTAPATLTLTLAAGDSSGTITVQTLTDSVLDPGETLTVTLDEATTTVGTATVDANAASATTTIVDDGMVTVSVSATAETVPEGEAAEFTVTLSGAVASDVALDWSTTDGTATADDDYTAVSGGTVTFVSGESLTQTISVTTLQDTLAESNERFTVTLAAPGSGLPIGVSLDTATRDRHHRGRRPNRGERGGGRRKRDRGRAGGVHRHPGRRHQHRGRWKSPSRWAARRWRAPTTPRPPRSR